MASADLDGSGEYLLQIPGMFFAHANLLETPELTTSLVVEFLQRGRSGL